MAHSNPPPLTVQLWYGTILVADLRNVIAHQGTWFGKYEQRVARQQGKLKIRVCDYISFCEKWHKRLKQGQNPDAKQFDEFKDVLNSGLWRIPFSDGTELKIPEGPIFVQREVSWNHPNNEPTRESSAYEYWCRRTGRCP
jgi:hypothetical protein